MKQLLIILALFTTVAIFTDAKAGDSNTVSSTVVTNNTPPTASSPSVVVNNSDICKSAYSGAIQTQVLGISSGVTVRDLNCQRLKLSRALYGMGMKVAAVSLLCQDARVYEAMEQAGTPCPYKGKIGIEAAKAWAENPEKRPDYDKWLKENDLEAYEKEWQNKATTWGIGIGAILLLLL